MLIIFFILKGYIVARSELLALRRNPKARLVPTLDGTGWMQYGTIEKLDRLLSDFFTSDGSQSDLYHRDFLTFQVIHADNVGDIMAMRDRIEIYLSTYLRKFFEHIDVSVSTTDRNGNVKDYYDLEAESIVGFFLEVTVTDDGSKSGFLKLEKPVFYTNGVFSYTLERFNEGF